MQGFHGGGPNQMHQMMMNGGPEAAEMLEAEAMAAAFRGVSHCPFHTTASHSTSEAE